MVINAFEQTKLILCLLLHLIAHKKATARRGPGLSGARKWAGNAEEGPMEDCLSSQVDGAEIRALFLLIQDKAKQKRKERSDSEIESALVGEQDGSSKVKP